MKPASAWHVALGYTWQLESGTSDGWKYMLRSKPLQFLSQIIYNSFSPMSMMRPNTTNSCGYEDVSMACWITARTGGKEREDIQLFVNQFIGETDWDTTSKYIHRILCVRCNIRMKLHWCTYLNFLDIRLIRRCSRTDLLPRLWQLSTWLPGEEPGCTMMTSSPNVFLAFRRLF